MAPIIATNRAKLLGIQGILPQAGALPPISTPRSSELAFLHQQHLLMMMSAGGPSPDNTPPPQYKVPICSYVYFLTQLRLVSVYLRQRPPPQQFLSTYIV